MADPLAIIEERLRRLEATVVDVDRRLRALEQQPATQGPEVEGGETPPPGTAPVRLATGPERLDVAGVLSLLGRTFVTFGGAYLLRALTEAGTLPRGAGIVLGLLYAAGWLVAAWRAAGVSRPVSASFHGIAAVLVGFPLLWEASTRFGFLAPPSSAAALALFSGLALAVAWRKALQSLAGATTLIAMGAAVALMSATGQVAPFAVFLILLGVATVWLGYDRDWFWLRWPAALVADFAVFGLALRAMRPQRFESPEVAIGVQLLLLVAYLSSFAARTLVRGRLVIPFEVVQTIATLAVGLGGAAAVARATGTGEAALGLASTLLGIGGYAVAFAFVERRQGLGANFYFYATLALVFTLVGTGVLLPGGPFAIVAAALAVVTSWLAFHYGRLALSLHGAVYAIAASSASGLLAAAMNALVGTIGPQGPALTVAFWAALVAPVLCMAIKRPARVGEHRALASIPRAVMAVVLVVGLGGTLVEFLARATAGSPPDPGVVATVRTAVLAAAAIVLAVATRIDHLAELGWLLYPVLFLGALKLLFEDLQRSRAATLSIALALYGIALIAAPWIVKRGRPDPAGDGAPGPPADA